MTLTKKLYQQMFKGQYVNIMKVNVMPEYFVFNTLELKLDNFLL